jgi:DNA-binding NarL/FixJ family response regulator
VLKKDSAAVVLGRKGGKASAEKLTHEQRKQKARRAAQIRWANKAQYDVKRTSVVSHGSDRRQLTKRERAVALFAAQGRSNQWIAQQLRISPNTVKKHVSAVLDKLGASNRTELAFLLTSSPSEQTPTVAARLAAAVLLHAAKEAYESAQHLLEQGHAPTKPDECRPGK